DALVGPAPNVRVFEHIDYLVWLLSRQSNWLPRATRDYLVRGMKEWAVWPWSSHSADSDYESPAAGELSRWLSSSNPGPQFEPPEAAMADLRDRIRYAANLLHLPETADEMLELFISEAVIEWWFRAQHE